MISGRLRLNVGAVDLVRVIGMAADAVRPSAEKKGVALEITARDFEEPVTGDADRLQQIVWNLLTNAVKFTPAGGRVVLSSSMTAEGGITLSVADTGIGMKPEDIPVALETFRQVDGGLTRRQQGTGLGLPLARTLAELHGGTLTIASTPGEGTAVTVTLPRERVIRRPLAAVDAA